MDFAAQANFTGVDERLVQDVLGEYGEMTRASMQTYFTRDEPRSYLYGLLPDYPRRGGKMMRSSLCIAMARATGAEVEDAIASAVAIELLHNALLVHDDIEDASDERRGVPTLHAKHGIPLAMNDMAERDHVDPWHVHRQGAPIVMPNGHDNPAREPVRAVGVEGSMHATRNREAATISLTAGNWYRMRYSMSLTIQNSFE